MHIAVDGKARGRQQTLERSHVAAVEAEAVGERQPAGDAAIIFRPAIVIDQARAPFAPYGGIIAARDQTGVLHRDHRLVIVAIERPGLHLAFGQLAAMQQPMKWMQVMIAPGADVAQRGLELLRRHDHSAISIPSSATSHPFAAMRRRSGEPSTRIGLVLLMWIKIFRVCSPANRCSVPPSPSIGMWPMRRR